MRHLLATTLCALGLTLVLAACATLPSRVEVRLDNQSVIVDRSCPPAP